MSTTPPNDQDVLKFKIEITSTVIASVTENPKSITFEVEFLHPCHYAVLADNGGLLRPLDRAVVNDLPSYVGFNDIQTISAFPYSFPASFTTSPDCGPQIITINEPGTAPLTTS